MINLYLSQVEFLSWVADGGCADVCDKASESESDVTDLRDLSETAAAFGSFRMSTFCEHSGSNVVRTYQRKHAALRRVS